MAKQGKKTKPDLVAGALAGLAAGLAASLVMDLAQRGLSAVHKSDDDDRPPATEQAADRLSQAVSGSPVPEASKAIAGQAVHYGFGALLGVAYGIAAELYPKMTEGFGSVFGMVTSVVFDEAAVPAAGLGPSPADTRPADHIYGLTSHLIYGVTAEGTRRLVRAAL